MSTVNKDYIGIIRNVNGCVKFVKKEIQQKTALMNDLKAMLENPNRTIFDLQSRMDREFPASVRNFLDYLAPYSYSASYVNGVSYPKAPTYDAYKAEIEHEREEYIKIYEDKFASLEAENPQAFRTNVNESVDRAMEVFVESKKKAFYTECIRFCQAFSYTSILRELKSDPDVKMWSTDSVGWTDLPFQITDNIKIGVHTNFGYGWSSYFHLGLTYKGIDILPYSMFVKYYYADRRDLTRYTRRYDTDRTSWDYAFDFVETVARKAAEGDDSFATEYVMNEVKEMLSCLRNILNDPKTYFDTHIANKNPENDSHYLTVYNMNQKDHNRYSVYPYEMIDVFQAEKVSGALDFLEKISALEPIYGQAIAAADEIRSMARRLVPQIERNIARIATDVERLQTREDELSLQIDAAVREIAGHSAKISAILEEKRNDAKEGEKVFRSDVENSYRIDHPEYVALIRARDEKMSEREKICNEKSDRQAFLSRLDQCKAEIEKNELG